MKKAIFKKFFGILVVLCFLVSPLSVKAETKTLRQFAKPIGNSEYRKLTFDDEKGYDTNAKEIETFNSSGKELVPAGDSRYVIYPEALNYFGTILTVKVEITVLTGNAWIAFVKNDTTYNYKNQLIYADSNIGTADIKISFFDEENQPFDYTGLYGLIDPDLGNYRFNLTDRNLYYKDAGKEISETEADYSMMMSDNINVVYGTGTNNDGLFPLDTTVNFHEGIVFISLSEPEFTVSVESHQDWIVTPYLYSMDYKVDYVLNDNEEFPATNPNKEFVSYAPGVNKTIEKPSRPGYEFVKWTRKDITNPDDPKNSSVLPDDRGDKTFVAEWRAIEYKIKFDPNNDSFPGEATEIMEDQIVKAGDNPLNQNLYSATGYKWLWWSLEEGVKPKEFDDKANYKVTAEDIVGKSEGDYLDTLYAQWEPIKYLVRYDKNAEDATGEMDDQKPLEYDTKYNLNPNEFERFGYDWVGWNTVADKSGDSYSNEQEFENLTAEDNGIVTMYAQWEPWKHYIEYDGNGADNMDAMPLQTFNFTSEQMTSLKNAFVREGYWFNGFRVEINGSVRIVWDPQDFKDILVELGRGSKITLRAQWEKKPVRFVAPVTGIDD